MLFWFYVCIYLFMGILKFRSRIIRVKFKLIKYSFWINNYLIIKVFWFLFREYFWLIIISIFGIMYVESRELEVRVRGRYKGLFIGDK